ncbi:AMP-binding protein, partial [Pseudoalteromonas sp. McH1-42]|uniref:AMP-binding protein n=1 Tax=Pseudoalteromonas sp. McH1-42 TaxID=2917752 RepID=UPI001EF69D2E
YTSGSTGQPKGVLTPHRAVQRLISTPHFMTLDSDTVFLHSANIAFDAATIELWGPLLNGGRCVLYPQDQLDIHALNTLIDSQAINSMWLTAGLFSEWSHHCDGRTSLRYVLAGGDIVHGADVMRVQQALPQAQVINGYGPTENTTFSCCYAIPTLHESQDIAIGTPLNGDQALVLSDDLSLVPYGSVGELCVGGDGLAQGYLNQPELTAERFIDNPFYDPEVAGSSERLYRTGDLVRYLADGNLAFVGRADDQIKIRGFRVELGEIAQQLSRQSDIDSALVLAKNGPAGTYLVAYVQPVETVTEQAQPEFMTQTLATLAQTLPDYMVPKLGVVIDDWPLTANGKVNKKALPEADTSALQGTYVAPQGEREQLMVTLCGELLAQPAEQLSVTANFFTLGGHSL